jgi:hypothetical protein
MGAIIHGLAGMAIVYFGACKLLILLRLILERNSQVLALVRLGGSENESITKSAYVIIL